MKNSKILISDSWVRLKSIGIWLVRICLAVPLMLAVNTLSTTSNDNPTQGVLGAAIALIVGAIVQVVFTLGVIVYALQRLNKYQGTTSNID